MKSCLHLAYTFFDRCQLLWRLFIVNLTFYFTCSLHLSAIFISTLRFHLSLTHSLSPSPRACISLRFDICSKLLRIDHVFDAFPPAYERIQKNRHANIENVYFSVESLWCKVMTTTRATNISVSFEWKNETKMKIRNLLTTLNTLILTSTHTHPRTKTEPTRVYFMESCSMIMFNNTMWYDGSHSMSLIKILMPEMENGNVQSIHSVWMCLNVDSNRLYAFTNFTLLCSIGPVFPENMERKTNAQVWI